MEDLKFHVFSLKEEEEVLVESSSIHLRFRSFLNEGERGEGFLERACFIWFGDLEIGEKLMYRERYRDSM